MISTRILQRLLNSVFLKEHGAKYVFVNDSDKKIYAIDAQDKVAPHAGHHVVVKGTVDGSALKLTSIELAK